MEARSAASLWMLETAFLKQLVDRAAAAAAVAGQQVAEAQLSAGGAVPR